MVEFSKVAIDAIGATPTLLEVGPFMAGTATFGVTDGTYYYCISSVGPGWGTNIYKIPLSGGSYSILFAGTETVSIGATGIATNGTNVYFSDSTGLHYVPCAGGAMVDIDLSGGAGRVALDATYIYWTVGTTVKSMVIGGNPATDINSLATGETNLVSLAVTPTLGELFWGLSGASGSLRGYVITSTPGHPAADTTHWASADFAICDDASGVADQCLCGT